MKNSGYCLRFYMHSEYHKDGKPLHAWILERAKALNIHGGSCFETSMGFGRHGQIHEDKVVGYPADFAPVVVEFYVSQADAVLLRTEVGRTGIEVFVSECAAEFEDLNTR